MKPLAAIDHLHADFPSAPMIDISYAGKFVAQARESIRDLREVRPPYPVQIVGLKIATLAHALSVDPYPPFFVNLGHPVEIAFVVCDLPNLIGFPFVTSKNGQFGSIDTPAIVDDEGRVAPEKILQQDYSYDLLCGRWFRAAVDCFHALQCVASARLEPVPLDLTHGEQRRRARKHLPAEYLQLRGGKNG